MLKIIKNIIKKILHLIRSLLSKIIINTIPLDLLSTKDNKKTSYEYFYNEEVKKSYEHFKDWYLQTVHLSGDDILHYAITHVEYEPKNLYLEFGVWEGRTINLFSNHIQPNKIHGFDTFEGINEDWAGTDKPKGFYTANNNLPKVNDNCVLIKGLIQDTLPIFLEEKDNDEIAFVHMDINTYESSKFVLELIKPRLKINAIILLRGCHNYPGWSVGEYRAFQEIFNKDEYQFLAFSKDGSPAVLRYISSKI
tara:strand:+ start:1121 stop:1873 length:753 start_codon:yes stop_codon:yes gene_type:complete